MTKAINRTEEYVYRICRGTFLSLWSYANPRGKQPGRELCDILVVCDPHVIIISVKNVDLKGDMGGPVAWERWQRRAIKESVRQIAGAERFLSHATTVLRHDGSHGLPLPPVEARITHRVAIALGSRGEVPVVSGDLGKGYVHVLTDESFELVLRELDTITDFVSYLSAKETLPPGVQIDIVGSEADLLAFYLSQGRAFPSDFDLLLIADDMWASYAAREEVARKGKADIDSYVWDRIIEIVAQSTSADGDEPAHNMSQTEKVLRDMAKESRFARRQLGSAFKKFMETKELRARIVKSTSEVLYMFMRAECKDDPEPVVAELTGRCLLAKGINQDANLVIGIAAVTHAQSTSSRFMLCRLEMPGWTPANQREFDRIQGITGAFADPVLTERHVDEYPQR